MKKFRQFQNIDALLEFSFHISELNWGVASNATFQNCSLLAKSWIKRSLLSHSRVPFLLSFIFSPSNLLSYISLSPFFSHMQDSLLALLIVVDVLFLFVHVYIPTPCPSSPLFLSLSLSLFLYPSLSLSRRRPVEKDGTYGIPRAKSCLLRARYSTFFASTGLLSAFFSDE